MKFEDIVQKPNPLHKIIHGLQRFREMYPSINICLNVAITDGINSSEKDFMDILKFATSIHANVKAIQLYPDGCEGYVPITQIEGYLLKNGFIPFHSATRKQNYTNGNINVGLTKIFCSYIKNAEKPVEYCKYENDIFVSPNGRIYYCREDDAYIDICEAIKSRNENLVIQGIRNALDMFGEKCRSELKEKEKDNE